MRAGLREKAQADAADKLRRSQEESGYTRFSRSAYAQFGIKRGEVMDSILKAAEPGDMHSGEFLKSVHGEMRRRMNAVAAFLEILENRSIKLVPQEEEIALYHLFFIVAAANMHPANAENTPRVRGGIIAQADGYFSDSKERGAAMLALGLPRNFIAYIGGACALHFGNLAKNSK